MEIKEITFQEIEQSHNVCGLLTTSRQFADFCKRYWAARPIILGFFDEKNVLSAYLILFSWQEKELRYLGASLKTYTEIVYLRPITVVIKELNNFLKNHYSFDVLDLSFCPIVNRLYDIKQETSNFKTAALVLDVGQQTNLEKIRSKILDKKTRNQIKKTEQFNLKILSSNDIDSFYLLYRETMSRLNAKPKDKKYFFDLQESFGSNFRIVFVEYGDEKVGANLFLITGDYLSLMFNVSLKEYWKFYINDFLYWEMIKIGLSEGIRWFDFGINAKRDSPQIHFKEGFGARPNPIAHKFFFGSCKGRYKIFWGKFIFLLKLIRWKFLR